MSAYDMKFSDAIYGEAGRYVSRKRLVQMMEHEYGLLEKRLAEIRGRKLIFLHLPIRFPHSTTIRTMNAMDGWVYAFS